MRRLALGDHGLDVEHLQRAINARAKARGIPGIPVDGKFGDVTRRAAERIARALGAREDTIAKRPLTIGIQRIIRWPALRTPAQYVRARQRAGGSPELTMFDAVNIGNIPAEAKAVAGYVNGHWPTYDEVVKRWPHAYHLSIAVTTAANAECLDIEPGDARPQDAPAWVIRQMSRGVKRPVVYASVSSMPQVLAALKAAGIGRDRVRLWTAHYTQTPHRCTPKCWSGLGTEADATQYTSQALGRSLDASSVAKGFFQ